MTRLNLFIDLCTYCDGSCRLMGIYCFFVLFEAVTCNQSLDHLWGAEVVFVGSDHSCRHAMCGSMTLWLQHSLHHHLIPPHTLNHHPNTHTSHLSPSSHLTPFAITLAPHLTPFIHTLCAVHGHYSITISPQSPYMDVCNVNPLLTFPIELI